MESSAFWQGQAYIQFNSVNLSEGICHLKSQKLMLWENTEVAGDVGLTPGLERWRRAWQGCHASILAWRIP